MYLMNLEDWEIDLKYVDEVHDSKAGCITFMDVDTDVDYQRAQIRVYWKAFKAQDELAELLFHELCHIQMAEFDLVFEITAASSAKHRIFQYACERAVKRMTDSVQYDYKNRILIGKRVFLKKAGVKNDSPDA